MANAWFRLYSEFATDPKVQMLSECDQRRLVMLFCFRCNGSVTLHDEEVTFLLRINNDEWAKTKALFLDKGFINSDNEILNWDKRQFTSDTSKNRVAAYRERKKQQSNNDVTLQKRHSNAIDTEQIQNRTDKKHLSTSAKLTYSDVPEFLQFWSAYPRKDDKKKSFEAWLKHKPPIDQVLTALAWQVKTEQWTKDKGQYIPLGETYINGARWEAEPVQVVKKPNGVVL